MSPPIGERGDRRNVPSLQGTIDQGKKVPPSHLPRYLKAGSLSGMACPRNTTLFSSLRERRNGILLPTRLPLGPHLKLLPREGWNIHMARPIIRNQRSLRIRMVARVSGILTGRWNPTRRIEAFRAILGWGFPISGLLGESYADGGNIAICDESATGRGQETK
jgi:hypothetical protein